MTNKKILHISTDEKFINGANFIFEQAFPGENTFLILTEQNTAELKYVTATENVIAKHFSSESLNNLVEFTKPYRIVVFHGLNWLQKRLVLKLWNKARLLWIIWGFEIHYTQDLRDKFLGEKTKKLRAELALEEIASNPSPVNKAIFEILAMGAQCDDALQWLKAEGAIHQETKHIPFTYYPLEHLFPSLDLKVQSDQILLGNSASLSNNHIEALDILAKLPTGERKIYLPLNYGDRNYAQKIIEYGEQLFPKRIVPILDFLPLHEYNSLVANCGFVVMNHLRQQAFGNVIASVYLGAKVFIHDSSTYRYLKRIGCHIFLINEDLQDRASEALLPLTADQISENRRILLEEMKTDNVVRRLRDSIIKNFDYR